MLKLTACHVLRQNAQNVKPHLGHCRNRSQPVPSSASEGFITGVWQCFKGQCMIDGSTPWLVRLWRCLWVHSPPSRFLFSRSHRQRCRSPSETTHATSSSWASRPTLTQSGSAQPTRPTSPSSIHNFQKSSRHDRQKTWVHDSRKHFDPFRLVKHIEHRYEFFANSSDFDDVSCACNIDTRACGAVW